MPAFHNNVTLRGFSDQDSIYTFNLATGITKPDEGKAVTLDTTGPNKVKLAGDGDTIIGRLSIVEERTTGLVGSIEMDFSNPLPVLSGQTVNLGQTVVGAGNGFVKAAATPNWTANFVVEKIGTTHVVVMMP